MQKVLSKKKLWALLGPQDRWPEAIALDFRGADAYFDDMEIFEFMEDFFEQKFHWRKDSGHFKIKDYPYLVSPLKKSTLYGMKTTQDEDDIHLIRFKDILDFSPAVKKVRQNLEKHFICPETYSEELL